MSGFGFRACDLSCGLGLEREESNGLERERGEDNERSGGGDEERRLWWRKKGRGKIIGGRR